MTTIDGQEFRNTTVHLDNTLYRNCLIDHCQIVYSGGTPGGFVGCKISNNSIILAGAALETARFMASLHAVPELRHIVEGWINDIRSGPPKDAPPTVH